MANPVTYSALALTLADYAMQSNDPMIQKIAISLLGDVSILDDLPLVTNANLKVRGGRVTGSDLPNTGWGAINQAPTDIKSTTQSFEESASIVRERMQIDVRLMKQKDWIDDPIQTQINATMEAHRYDMNLAFFKNDPTADQVNPPASAYTLNAGPLGWAGLSHRLKNPVTYGLPVDGSGNTPQNINAGGINMKQNMTAADANNLLEMIGQAFAFLGASDGRGCVIYGNWLSKERLNRAVRLLGNGGGFKTTEDSFGRQVEMYRQAKVRDMGFRRDLITPIISNTLTNVGVETGSGAYTELFVVRYGDDHFKGWQTNPLKPENLGKSTEYGTYYNILVDWACGLYYPNQRSFARIYGLQMA